MNTYSLPQTLKKMSLDSGATKSSADTRVHKLHELSMAKVKKVVDLNTSVKKSAEWLSRNGVGPDNGGDVNYVCVRAL